MSVVLVGVTLYATLYSKFRLVVSSIEIYVNESLSTTLSGIDMTSDALGPVWLPIFSGLVEINGSANASFTPPYIGPPSYGSYSGEGSAKCTVSGGWRFMENSVWYDHPVTIPPLESEPGLCGKAFGPPPPAPQFTICAPFGLHLPEAVISTRTWGNHINSVSSIVQSAHNSASDGFGSHYVIDSINGSICLVPDLDKSLYKINNDFGASFFKWATPLCTGTAYRQIARTNSGGGGSLNGATTVYKTPVLLSHETAKSAEVFNAKHSIETFTTLPTYSPINTYIQKQVFDQEVDGSGNGYYQNNEEIMGFNFPTYVEDSTSGPAPYMDHKILLARYFNMACHPWWSYGYVPGKWDLYSSPTNWKEYWGLIREQYLAVSKKRNFVVTDALENSGHTPFLDNFNSNGEKDTDGNPVGLRWVGMCRWQTQSITPPSSIELTSGSSALWSVTDALGTLTFNAGNITVNSTVSELELFLDVNSYTSMPYMYPSICDRIFLNWTLTNVAYIKVYAVGQGGHEELYKWSPSDTTTERNHTYNIPLAYDNKYGGSWAIDNGAGIATDTGTDSDASGISSTLMSNPEYAENFQFSGTYSQKRIKFLIGFTSTSSPITLNYPIFYRCSNNKKQLWESAQCVSTIFKNGPGVRLGNNVYYSGGINVPPLMSGLSYKGTVIDWLMDRRALLEGVDPYYGGTINVTTELTQLYDTYEVQSVSAVDGNTIYSILPTPINSPKWVSSLVNLISEIPPLLGYAHNKRDSNWENISNQFSAGVWSICQLPRKFINSGKDPSVLTKPDGTVISTVLESFGNWFVSTSEPIIDNTENVDFKIKVSETEFAEVTPWHGYFSVINGSRVFTSYGCDTVHNNATGEYYYAYVLNNNIYVNRSIYILASSEDEVTQVTFTSNADSPSLLISPDGILYVVYNKGTSVYYRVSTDQGLTWNTEVLLFTEKYRCRTAVQESNGDILFVSFGYVSGTSGPGYLYSIPYNSGDVSFPSPTIIKDQTGSNIVVEEGSFDVSAVSGQILLYCRLSGDTVNSHFCSKDGGLTFDRIF